MPATPSVDPALVPVREALAAGDKAQARALLTPILRTTPSADAWVLAARACDTDEQAIRCLRRALELDMYHTDANRLLLKLEGVRPSEIVQREQAEAAATREALRVRLKTDVIDPKQAGKIASMPSVQPGKRRRSSPWRLLGCVSLLVGGAACTLLTFNLIGVISGVVTAATVLTGGPTPIAEYEGVPLALMQNAPAILPASAVEPLQGQTANVLDPGYTHAYTFPAEQGDEYAIYVQFLSLTANRVSRNVAVLNPDGRDIAPACTRDQILEGDNNITLICTITQTGLWTVRITGREGESVGVYFVGAQNMR
jgi:hypothetical protein